MTMTSEQLPLPFPGLTCQPTTAMSAGAQRIAQCGFCGTVLIIPTSGVNDDHPERFRNLGRKPCPACDHTAGWWRQDHPTGHSIAGWTHTTTHEPEPEPEPVLDGDPQVHDPYAALHHQITAHTRQRAIDEAWQTVTARHPDTRHPARTHLRELRTEYARIVQKAA